MTYVMYLAGAHVEHGGIDVPINRSPQSESRGTMFPFAKIERSGRMPQMIAKAIEEKIVRGEIKPGDTLPSETELMQQLGVGKYSVREALRVLETNGLIRVQHGSRKGPIVTKPTNSQVSDFLKRAIAVGEVSGHFITQFRMALEPSIAEIAASMSLDDSTIQEIENNIAQARAAQSRGEDLTDINADFHLLLAKATKNPLFIVIVDTLMHAPTVTNLLNPVKFTLDDSTIGHHSMILESIKFGDAARANRLMREHLLEIEALWSPASEQE